MKPANENLLYWRLSGFYFFYFASLGAILPYWSLYLKHQGFGALEISELMALILVTKIIAPNIWGWIADHTGRRMVIVRLGSLLAVVLYGGIFLGNSYWWIALVMFVFSFFWNAALPQFEATTLQHLEDKPHEYSSIRLWGSVGFILVAASLGYVFQYQSISLLPIFILIMLTGIWLVSLVVPEKATGYLVISNFSLREIISRPEVIALILVCFLLQASHGAYYTFYTLYMEGYGYSRSLIGQLWALGVAAEVLVFFMMHRLVPRFGLRFLFMAAALLTTLRWVLTACYPEILPLMFFSQSLHAASFGLYHAVAIQLFHRHFRGIHAGKGQALYSSLSFGAGGALGTYLSGIIWVTVNPASSFLLSAGMSGLAFLICWRWIKAKSE